MPLFSVIGKMSDKQAAAVPLCIFGNVSILKIFRKALLNSIDDANCSQIFNLYMVVE